MAALYPLVFNTQYKDKIWGGQKMRSLLGKDFSPLPNCGETWEISGVSGNVSVVRNGPLAGQSLTDIIRTYKQELLGHKVYERFGTEFPLLIKFIDANDDLSIQVHPHDALAKERHNSFGKTEMWYILQADQGARLNTGFNQPMDKEKYLKHLHENTLDQILNYENVEAGDVYFLPAGRVHYIGKGVFLAEIQQTSDITYRIYDFDRTDDKGNKRELHTELALEAIDYAYHHQYKTPYSPKANERTSLVQCPYFHTGLISATQTVERDYSSLDSFVIFICTEGSGRFEYPGGVLELTLGDCALVPAGVKGGRLVPDANLKVLEVYVP